MSMERGPTLRNRMAVWSPPQISVNALKLLGMVLMALYFFSAAVVQHGLIHVENYTGQQLDELFQSDSQAMFLGGVASVTMVLGLISIPIFAYLTVQGAQHTGSIQKYILTVFIFALVSEVPYDLAMSGQVWNWSSQNPLWAVFVALVMLWLMQIFQGEGLVPVVLSIAIAGAGCFWAILLNCLYGGGFVLIVAILFLLREHKGVSYLLGALTSLLFGAAALGFVPVAMCSGRRRHLKPAQKYACYAVCPVMMAVFALCVYLLN